MSNSHGNTPAAWTAVVVGLAGFTVGGVGLMFDPAKMLIFYVGCVIAVVGLVIYLVGMRLDAGD